MEAIKRRTVRIGTRKSRLALVQTNMVAEAIEAVCPEVKCELVPLMTKGDKILKTSLVASEEKELSWRSLNSPS